MNAHEDVCFLFNGYCRSFVKGQEHILGARHHGTHAACAVDLCLKLLGDGKHHRFLIGFTTLADGARIFAAVARVNDNHKRFGFAGLFGWFLLSDALCFRDGVGFALLALDFFDGIGIGPRSGDDLAHRIGVGRFQVDDDAVTELSNRLGIVYVGAHIVF